MAPQTVAFIIYLGCTSLLLVVLSLYAYKVLDAKNISFVKTVWSMRSVYGPVLVHIYDTSTDYIILVTWCFMASDEVSGKTDYENVDMLSFVVPSIILIFVYRTVYAVRHWTIFNGSAGAALSYRFQKQFDTFLIMLDLYIFSFVYQSLKAQYLSPSFLQKQLHLLESVFESMPQLVLQSIFLIRTYGTDLWGNWHDQYP